MGYFGRFGLRPVIRKVSPPDCECPPEIVGREAIGLGHRPEQCLAGFEQRAIGIGDANTKIETEGVTQVHFLDPAILDHETMRLGHLAAGREHLPLHMGAKQWCQVAGRLRGAGTAHGLAASLAL
jgi:hypothetical protein